MAGPYSAGVYSYPFGGNLVFQFNSHIYGGYPGKERPRLHYTVLSYRRSIFLAGILYIELALWFAWLYRSCAWAFQYQGLSLEVPVKAFYYSIVTITTIGYGDIAAKEALGFWIVIAEALSGMFMTLAILAKVIAYLPRPETLDEIERAPALKDQ